MSQHKEMSPEDLELRLNEATIEATKRSVRRLIEAEFPDYKPCPRCDGAGTVPVSGGHAWCPMCNGNGMVRRETP